MATSSARYTDLYDYARAAEQIDNDLIGQADRLIVRLSRFEATCREGDYAVWSEGLGNALRYYAVHAQPVDRRVRAVGEDFERADSSPFRFFFNLLERIIVFPGPWRIWQPPLLINPIIFPLPVAVLLPILPYVPDWLRGPVITIPEAKLPVNQPSPFKELITPKPLKGIQVTTVEDAGKYHFNQYEEWYAYWKDYATKENKLKEITSNADCGPASLIMALGILKLKINKIHDPAKLEPGKSLAVMRPIMVTDDPHHDGLTPGGDVALGEHKGTGAYTDWNDIKRGAESSGATYEKLTGEPLSPAEIKAALESGGVVIVSGTFIDKEPLPWAENRQGRDNTGPPGGAGAHIIAVVGLTPDGDFIVNDPARDPPPMVVSAATLQAFMAGNAGAARIGKPEDASL